MTTETMQMHHSTGSSKGWSGSTKVLVSLVAFLLVVVGYQAYSLHQVQERLKDLAATPKVTNEAKSPELNWDSWLDDWSGPSRSDTLDPFQELRQMRERMDQMFGQALRHFQDVPSAILSPSTMGPNMDLREEKDRYVLRMDIPGMDKTKLDIQVEDRSVKISGVREEVSEKSEGGKVLRHERRSGKFERMLQLPGPVKNEGIDAKYENGVLTLSIPKAKEATQSSRIQIK